MRSPLKTVTVDCLIFLHMAYTTIILLLLPAAVISDLTVNIFVGTNPRAEVSGSDTDIISDAERGTFHIYDNELKNAVGKYHEGRPDDVFVRSPTPWDDLYKRHNWTQISRTVKTNNATVKSYKVEPAIIASKNFRNNSPNPEKKSLSISRVDEITMDHLWNLSVGYITMGKKIGYNIDIGDGLKFSFKNTFLEIGSNKEVMDIGSKSAVEITLQPNQTAVAVLVASKGLMNVEVEYEATLSGSIAANYALTHKGHHFWSLDVNAVLDSVGIPKIVKWKEIIDVSFYTNGKVIVFDLNGNPLN